MSSGRSIVDCPVQQSKKIFAGSYQLFMFLIFNKEKIQTYAVSLLTVAVLIGVANIKNIGAIQVSATEKYLPIYNVQTEEPKIAFTMNCAW